MRIIAVILGVAFAGFEAGSALIHVKHGIAAAAAAAVCFAFGWYTGRAHA